MKIINRIIEAYKCMEANLDTVNCQHCPFGYGYYDTFGDTGFWSCNTDRLLDDAIDVLYLVEKSNERYR